jgi:peptidoglycan/xylan/chitin deacetylase (PgdA/CDA1 family)
MFIFAALAKLMKPWLINVYKSWIPAVFILLFACAGATDTTADTGKTETQSGQDTSWQPLQYDSTKKYIYLTFDDGPQPGTVTSLQICRSAGVKASFFMVGLHTLQKLDGRTIVAGIRNGYPGVLLANHSYSHAGGRYMHFYHQPDSVLLDFLQAEKLLQPRFRIGRLPGNRAWVQDSIIRASSLVKASAEKLDSIGYNLIGWDLEWGFRKKTARPVQSATLLAQQVDSAFAHNDTHTPAHLVILTHDRMFKRPADADSLARFIRLLKQNPAYVFETVDHYPGLKKLTEKAFGQ